MKVQACRIPKVILLFDIYELDYSLDLVSFQAVELCLSQLEIREECINLRKTQGLLVAADKVKRGLLVRLFILCRVRISGEHGSIQFGVDFEPSQVLRDFICWTAVQSHLLRQVVQFHLLLLVAKWPQGSDVNWLAEFPFSWRLHGCGVLLASRDAVRFKQLVDVNCFIRTVVVALLPAPTVDAYLALDGCFGDQVAPLPDLWQAKLRVLRSC